MSQRSPLIPAASSPAAASQSPPLTLGSLSPAASSPGQASIVQSFMHFMERPTPLPGSMPATPLANDLTYTRRIDPEQIGFDPCNRDTTGGNYMDVHALISDIKVVGWSDAATKDAACVEISPGDTVIEASNRLITESVPLMSVAPGALRYSSVSCSHTNAGLRAIKASCTTSSPPC